MCSLQQNNLTPSLFIPPHTYTRHSLSLSNSSPTSGEKQQQQPNDVDVNDDYDDMAHLQVYDLPSLTNVWDIYTKVWVSGRA